MLKYKNYRRTIEFDPIHKLFYSEVIGLRDVITFQGNTAQALEQAFKDSIDDYLTWCTERGEKPEKAFSGKVHVRISPHLHAKLVHDAQAQGISLNSYIVKKLEKEQ